MDIDEDRGFQEKFWSFQRVAWVGMVLVLVAALAGLTGSGGPLSQATAQSPGGSLDYPRIARWQAADQMVVTAAASASSPFTVELDSAFARTFTIEDVEPEPSRSIATAAGHRFEFDLGDAPGEKAIVFHLRPDRPAWPTRIRARLGDGPELPMRMTVLP